MNREVASSRGRTRRGAPVLFSERILRNGASSHGAVILTPERPNFLGRSELERLKQPASLSPVDQLIIEEVWRRRERVQIALFRASNDKGEPLWGFAPDLTKKEAAQLGYLCIKSLLPIHRCMMAGGIALLIHTDLQPDAGHAMRQGARRLRDELDKTRHGHPAVVAADRWILRHMLFHFSLPLEHVVEKVLLPQLRLIDRRWDRQRQLADDLPDTVWRPRG